MFDTVIFDVGNVLLKVENDSVQEDISQTLGINLEDVKYIWNKLIPNYLCTGKITEKEFWEMFFKKLNIKQIRVPKNLLSRAYEKKFRTIENTFKIVENLKRNGYKLGIISDTIAGHADVSKKYGLFKYFKVVTLSYQVGLRKPNPKIFKLTLRKLKSVPENSIFIDDIAEYVEAAKKLGMTGIQFESAQKFMTALKNLGVNVY